MRVLRSVLAVLGLTFLSACWDQQTEAETRAHVREWVFLAQTRVFVSKATCTVAVFETLAPELRENGSLHRVRSVVDATRLLEQELTVAFDMPGVAPNTISEDLMSRSLPGGLGLVSSFIGPSRSCMDENLQADMYRALMSPDTTLVYDPLRDALLLLHRPTGLAFYLRGNV